MAENTGGPTPSWAEDHESDQVGRQRACGADTRVWRPRPASASSQLADQAKTPSGRLTAQVATGAQRRRAELGEVGSESRAGIRRGEDGERPALAQGVSRRSAGSSLLDPVLPGRVFDHRVLRSLSGRRAGYHPGRLLLGPAREFPAHSAVRGSLLRSRRGDVLRHQLDLPRGALCVLGSAGLGGAGRVERTARRGVRLHHRGGVAAGRRRGVVRGDGHRVYEELPGSRAGATRHGHGRV
eukprot:scaffold58_cov256-Pinguiococcus_pyrenoidosus.AAC.4